MCMCIISKAVVKLNQLYFSKMGLIKFPEFPDHGYIFSVSKLLCCLLYDTSEVYLVLF